jgi:PAS domain S-box-containing protein
MTALPEDRAPDPNDRARHLNAVLRAIRNVNQLIVRERNPARLLDGVCRCLTETRGYFNAWIVLLDDGAVRRFGQSGLGAEAPAVERQLAAGKFPGCVRRALAGGELVLVHDPVSECRECPRASSYAGRCGLAIPIEHGTTRYGVATVSVPTEFADDPEEHELLAEVAGDLGFALHAADQEEAHRRAEAALRESEERYRRLVFGNADAIVVCDAKSLRFEEVNPACEELYGYTASEFSGMTVNDVTAEPEATAESVRRTLEGTLHHIPLRYHRKKDGTVFPVEISASLFEQGDRSHLCSVVRDISERVHARAALQQNLAFVRSLLDTIPSPIFYKDAHGVYQGCNPAFAEQIIGLPRERIAGSSLFDLPEAIPPDLAKVYHEQDQRLIAQGGVHRYEAPVQCADGVRREFLFTKATFDGADGEPAGLIGVMLDITERKRAEEAAESLARFPREDPNPVFRVCRDGRLDYANPAGQQLISGQPEGLSSVIPGLRGLIAGALDAATTSEIEIEQDGRALSFVVAPVLEGGYVNLYGQDVTERRRLEERLAQSHKMEAVGQLAGGIAHDFNNLLTAINGYAEMVVDELPEGSPLREDMVQVIDAADRAALLTRQLLTFARRERSERRTLDLNDLAASTLKLLRRTIPENIEITFLPGDAVPPVCADPGQLTQVMMNLAVNARDAMPRGGRLSIQTHRAELDTEAARASGMEPRECALLVVSDTGCGMDPETAARAFEPFFTTKAVGQGTGLGLATVYGIVEQHGGTITLDSEPEHGSTFRLALPAAERSASAPEAAEPRSLPTGSDTLLLVEDEEAVRVYAARLLHELGYTVLAAATPADAELIFSNRGGEIDLLVTDFIMPGANGRELHERLAARKPDLKVIYISGYTGQAVDRNGPGGEPVPFLQKPFDCERLAHIVRDVLDA